MKEIVYVKLLEKCIIIIVIYIETIELNIYLLYYMKIENYSIRWVTNCFVAHFYGNKKIAICCF